MPRKKDLFKFYTEHRDEFSYVRTAVEIFNDRPDWDFDKRFRLALERTAEFVYLIPLESPIAVGHRFTGINRVTVWRVFLDSIEHTQFTDEVRQDVIYFLDALDILSFT